jgi:hypothetical protein
VNPFAHEATWAAIDKWIARGIGNHREPGPRCVVYAGQGQWWPAVETHDGPQQIELGLELDLLGLAEWCEARP